MDPKVRELLSKVKEGAVTYGKVAGKFASEAAEKARLNLQIFDLNTEIDICDKEIGKLVYAMHAGEEVSNDAVQAQIEAIDAKKAQLAELRAKLAAFKTEKAEECTCSCCCEEEHDDGCKCGCEEEHEHEEGCCCCDCEAEKAEEPCCEEEKCSCCCEDKPE